MIPALPPPEPGPTGFNNGVTSSPETQGGDAWPVSLALLPQSLDHVKQHLLLLPSPSCPEKPVEEPKKRLRTLTPSGGSGVPRQQPRDPMLQEH